MKIAYAPVYCHPLPEGHRFPMLKYELIPAQLLHEGTIREQDIHTPEILPVEVAELAHEKEYLGKLLHLDLSYREERKTGFPLSPLLIERERTIMQGTLDMSLYALKNGIGLNVAGGTHHAYSNRGEGFCLMNDIAISAAYLLHHRLRRKILVVDLDVHQGNGTASIFQDNRDVFTFSMHGANNYPLHKEQSDLDIPLPDGIGDEEYLNLLQTHLSQVTQHFKPDFIFYQCGVDILSSDKLGRLGISLEGCKQRDHLVLGFARKNNIPICCSMGGGYSEDIRIIVEAHCNTFRLAASLYA